MQKKKIIFILSNIYESINGVSNKYINFIDFLINSKKNLDINIEIILITTFKNNELLITIKKKYKENYNFSIIKTNGITLPFYKDIKVPIINNKLLNEQITEGNELIIFNGEFIWLYELLKKQKNKNKFLKIYPSWHTDYLFYSEKVYSKFNLNLINMSSFLNYLNYYLESKIFNGIIVTGEQNKKQFLPYTDNIFNANEINLEIFNNIKNDRYNNDVFNIIYTGRISKEKNIEEFLDCCLELHNKKYNIIINIIGDGPYLNNIKDIIPFKFQKIESKIIFFGNLDQAEINKIYQQLDNRIFLFTSMSETFGKTPMEAGATGIPIFIKSSSAADNIYINKKNAFVFDTIQEFIILFEYFIKLDNYEKQLFAFDSFNNIKKYEQLNIFKNWLEFLIEERINKDKIKINLFDIFTFHGISSLINCSSNIMSD